MKLFFEAHAPEAFFLASALALTFELLLAWNIGSQFKNHHNHNFSSLGNPLPI
jgi:hypothetical protein